jgi:hypothetical protein
VDQEQEARLLAAEDLFDDGLIFEAARALGNERASTLKRVDDPEGGAVLERIDELTEQFVAYLDPVEERQFRSIVSGVQDIEAEGERIDPSQPGSRARRLGCLGPTLLGLYYALFCLLSPFSLLSVDQGASGELLALSGVTGALAVGVGGAISLLGSGRGRAIGGTLLIVGGVLGSVGLSPFLCLGGCSGTSFGGVVLAAVIFFGGIPIISGAAFLTSGSGRRTRPPM